MGKPSESLVLAWILEFAFVRDVLNFESIFGLSIIYVERDTIFGEFWKCFRFSSRIFCEVEIGRFAGDRVGRFGFPG